MLQKEQIRQLVNARDILLCEEREAYNNVAEGMKNYVDVLSRKNDKDTNEARRLINAYAQHYILFVLDVLSHPIVFSSQDLEWTNGRREYIACGVIDHEVWEGPYGVQYRYVSVQGNDPRYWANFNQFDATTTLRLVNICQKAFDEEFKGNTHQKENKPAERNVESNKGVNASFLRERLHNAGEWVRIYYNGPQPCKEPTDEITAHKSASTEQPYYIDALHNNPEGMESTQERFATFHELVAWLNEHSFTNIEGENEETNQSNMEE